MAKESLNGVLQYLRKLAAVHADRELSDRDLLERFVGARDEAAFTVLIERHGPMVLGVCRRSLPTFHDAEDACQATFLVLARKAASVRKKTSLSSWLHGVACRVAAHLKRDHARRKTRERGVDGPAAKDPAAQVTWREVQTILDEELERLPERYRTPIILCYLECMTRDEAAKRLGLSPTTLHGRLERARDSLRERLAKRVLTLSAAMCAAALAEGVAQAALEPTFVVSSTKAALLLASGQALTDGVVATGVVALTREVLKTMFLTKLKLGIGAALLASVCAVLIGGSFTSPTVAQDATPRDNRVLASSKTENDTEFIRRVSKDLRGIEPTPAEVHFFVASKDEVRRQKLIDLFIQERQARKAERELSERIDTLVRRRWADEVKRSGEAASDAEFLRRTWLDLTGNVPSAAKVDSFLKGKDPNKRAKLVDRLLDREDVARIWDRQLGVVAAAHKSNARLAILQRKFYTELYAASNKADVARITQAYLDGMIEHVMKDARSPDVPDTMRQIIFVYESRGKTVEAAAWRDKLVREICGVEPTDAPAKEQAKARKLEDLPAYLKELGRLPAELTKAGKNDSEIVNELYRATLKRDPADSERAAMTKLLAGAKDRTEKARDLFWALVSSQEFLKAHNLDGNTPESLRLINKLSAEWDKKSDAKNR